MTLEPCTARNRREAALKRLLDQRRREIAEKLRGLRGLALPGAPASKDADDHAVDDLLREMEFALAQMRSTTLQQIDEAIRRLQNGTYGVCGLWRGHPPGAPEGASLRLALPLLPVGAGTVRAREVSARGCCSQFQSVSASERL